MFFSLSGLYFQSQTREYLVRLVYCSMLGYDVSFAYIHAIKLAQQGALLDKRAGERSMIYFDMRKEIEIF